MWPLNSSVNRSLGAQIQQQGGDPLLGITPAKSRHPIVQPALILPELKRDPQADGRILRDKLQQVPMIDHSDMRSGQALDRVRLAFEQHALDAHQIAGQEHHNDLSAPILDNAGACNPAGFEEVDRAALLAGGDKDVAIVLRRDLTPL